MDGTLVGCKKPLCESLLQFLSTSSKPAGFVAGDLKIAASPSYHTALYPLVYFCFDSRLQCLAKKALIKRGEDN